MWLRNMFTGNDLNWVESIYAVDSFKLDNSDVLFNVSVIR